MKKLLLILFLISFALAQNNLCNLLPDKIDGFNESMKCKYVNMQSNYGTSSQAYKEYKKNDNKIALQLMKGSMAYQLMSPFMMPVQVETNEMLMKVTSCNGFKCAITYDKKENNGIIIVLLDQNAPSVLTLNYENMNADEAMELLNEIDIKKIKNNL
ncbi:hypothetical protein [Nautilia lithotrophica]